MGGRSSRPPVCPPPVCPDPVCSACRYIKIVDFTYYANDEKIVMYLFKSMNPGDQLTVHIDGQKFEGSLEVYQVYVKDFYFKEDVVAELTALSFTRLLDGRGVDNNGNVIRVSLTDASGKEIVSDEIVYPQSAERVVVERIPERIP